LHYTSHALCCIYLMKYASKKESHLLISDWDNIWFVGTIRLVTFRSYQYVQTIMSMTW
jgi:hypothetical protein